jgi:hypothetical protein
LPNADRDDAAQFVQIFGGMRLLCLQGSQRAVDYLVGVLNCPLSIFSATNRCISGVSETCIRHLLRSGMCQVVASRPRKAS